VSAVIAAGERCTSLPEFLAATLDAIDDELGHERCAFMLVLAEPPLPGRRAFAGVTHGWAPVVLEEYFERWADYDPLGSEPARSDFHRNGSTTTHDLYPRLDPARRRFIDEFLRPVRATEQLSLRLRGSWTDGHLTVMGAEQIGERDRMLLSALTPQLAKLLRERLPRGMDAPLSVREAQVAELVAVGFSNREIGEVLHVEEDTVKKHVSHVLKRLGMERRTQLAVAWATGRRLDVPKLSLDY
jgi:DNA-binding CsgD family transcriptional regulator